MNITRRPNADFAARRGGRLGSRPCPNAGSFANYALTEHWWGMLVDISKCIGCGNCVRACAAENDVPEGYFRTWVERYHVSDYDLANPWWIHPTAVRMAFRRSSKPGGKPSSFRKCAITAPIRPAPRLPGRRHVHHPGWRRARGQEVLHRLPVLHPSLPLRLPLPESQDANGGEVHALLYTASPRGLTTACCEACPTGARQAR